MAIKYAREKTGWPVLPPVYASNSSTTTSNDTTSFAYGEDGALVQEFAATTVNAILKRVRSPYPNPKFATVQIKLANRQWIDVGSTAFNYKTNDTASQVYGIEIAAIAGSTTDYDVAFYSQVLPGVTWASQKTIGTRWRVVFSDVPVPAEFREATATDFGTVKGGKVPGNQGDSIAAGYIGQIVTATYSGVTIGTTSTNLANPAVTKGTWLVTVNGYGNKGSATSITGSLGFVAGAAGTIIGEGTQVYRTSLDTGASINYSCLVRVTADGALAFNSTSFGASATSHGGAVTLVRVG